MRFLAVLVLYLGVSTGANADTAALEALREGHMKKLTFHSEPVAISEKPFVDQNEVEGTLQNYRGKYLVLNFWATWCAPCRKEMPSLDRLQAELGDESFQVVTIATGRNSPTGIRRFFEEVEVTRLQQYRDIRQGIARDMAVLGLPITVIINPEGQEIARLQGDAEWDSPSAIAILSALKDSS